MPKYTEVRRRENEKYNAKACDRIEIRAKAGEKEELRQHAEKNGKGLNAFVNRAIDKAIGGIWKSLLPRAKKRYRIVS